MWIITELTDGFADGLTLCIYIMSVCNNNSHLNGWMKSDEPEPVKHLEQSSV